MKVTVSRRLSSSESGSDSFAAGLESGAAAAAAAAGRAGVSRRRGRARSKPARIFAKTAFFAAVLE